MLSMGEPLDRSLRIRLDGGLHDELTAIVDDMQKVVPGANMSDAVRMLLREALDARAVQRPSAKRRSRAGGR